MVERWVKRGQKSQKQLMTSFMDGHHGRWKWRLLHFCCVKLLLFKKTKTKPINFLHVSCPMPKFIIYFFFHLKKKNLSLEDRDNTSFSISMQMKVDLCWKRQEGKIERKIKNSKTLHKNGSVLRDWQASVKEIRHDCLGQKFSPKALNS